HTGLRVWIRWLRFGMSSRSGTCFTQVPSTGTAVVPKHRWWFSAIWEHWVQRSKLLTNLQVVNWTADCSSPVASDGYEARSYIGGGSVDRRNADRSAVPSGPKLSSEPERPAGASATSRAGRAGRPI